MSQALTQGLKAGVNIDTFKEILVQSYAYCGFPRSLNALNTLMKLAEKEGYQTPQKEELSSFTSGKSLELGTQNQTRLIGHPVSGPIYDFAPAIDAFLKAHLFGDIFMQPTVDWQTRELATIAMLASLDKTKSQLNSHIAIGKHNGLSDAAVDELLAEVKRLKAERVLFGFGEENTAYAPYFTGKSYLAPLTQGEISSANVTFEPGARNNWHIHHKNGQTLLVVAGKGWYQEEGKPARALTAGDVVQIPAGVKHWHGATSDSWFSHISLSVPHPESETEWLEPVQEADYLQLNQGGKNE